MDTLKILSNKLKDEKPRNSQPIWDEIMGQFNKLLDQNPTPDNFETDWNMGIKLAEYGEMEFDEGFETGFKAATKLIIAGMQ